MVDTQESMKNRIINLVKEYCDTYHNQDKPFKEGDRIPYASRVYDNEEMVNLVDSALEFWLTSGRYTDEFEKKLAEYLQVKYCSLVNSGSSNEQTAIKPNCYVLHAITRNDELFIRTNKISRT